MVIIDKPSIIDKPLILSQWKLHDILSVVNMNGFLSNTMKGF